MHSMAEWYMRGEHYDQAKLSRILDVAQDLKVRPFLSQRINAHFRVRESVPHYKQHYNSLHYITNYLQENL